MCKPRYQDYNAERIPTFKGDNYNVRVMSGQHEGTEGPIAMKNPGILFDISIRRGGRFEHTFPANWNGFAYVYDKQASGTINGKPAEMQSAHVLENDGEKVVATTDGKLNFLLFVGQPINEPIVQHGPFVMNTEEEIREAFMDYRSGRLQAADVEIMN